MQTMLEIWKNLFLFLILFLLNVSCAHKVITNKQSSHTVNIPDNQSRSCAYFYFLWGNHSEYTQRFTEALDAYQKASLCDPNSGPVLEKLIYTSMKIGAEAEAARYLQILNKKHPENIERQLLLAHLFVQLEKREEAIELYLYVLKDNPENISALLQLALIYSIEKKFRPAEKAFLTAIKLQKNLYPANLYLARLYAENDEIQKAFTWYRKSLDLKWSPELINEMIKLGTKNKQYDDLLRIYESVLKKNPLNELAGFGMIQTLLLLGKEKQAISKILEQKIKNKAPQKYDLILSRYYFSKKKFKEAESLLLSTLKETPSSIAHYLLALTYLKQKKNTLALKRLKFLNPQDSEYQDAIHLQVKILQDMNKNNEAEVLLQKKIADKIHVQPFDYLLLASLYQNMKKNDLAVEILELGTKAFNQDEQLLFELGLLLEENGQPKLAIKKMQQLLAINSQHAEALNYIGYTWADKNIHLKQALKLIQQAVRILPNNCYIHDSLGWAYYRLGEFEKARKELESAISLAPKDPFIYDHLGDVYLQLLLPGKALNSYKEAYILFSSQEKKMRVKNKIDTIEKIQKIQ